MRRKNRLVIGEIYHVMNKSIAGYQIFNSPADYERLLRMLDFFSYNEISDRFYLFAQNISEKGLSFDLELQKISSGKNKRIRLIAYCIMPTHIHLVLQEIQNAGISRFMSDLSNSYAKYFNPKHKRQGPLWSGPFKNVSCLSDEQLLHLTRYIHLNPVTAYLTNHPEEWPFSSYSEYLDEKHNNPRCDFKNLISILPKNYAGFVNDRAAYQRELAKIKSLILE